jgi:cellulose synthase/poly-beta-1,6-N-acetylglucosamine synthase-like glycosyltransferase
MIVLTSIVGITYAVLIGSFYKGLLKTKPLLVTEESTNNSYSILIALRNEEKNLEALFESLKKLSYPKDQYEIIFINDHSEDTSIDLLSVFKAENLNTQIQILHNIGIGKKAALSMGVAHSNYDWILTTDADCTLPITWIQCYDTLLQQEEYKYISGPVSLTHNNTFLNQFQNIEFLSLQGTTMGSYAIHKPFMSNGANSGFSRSVFLDMSGYKGNESIASGDDVFLLEKIISKYPKGVAFIKSRDAIVVTESETTWRGLINQKIRWAAKATSYKNRTGIWVGTIVFLSNLLLLLLLALSWKLAAIFFAGKLILDFIFLKKTVHFFKIKLSFPLFIWSSILYPFFNVWVFLLSQFKGFEWKGRTLKK